MACCGGFVGDVDCYYDVVSTIAGVRPACILSSLTSDTAFSEKLYSQIISDKNVRSPGDVDGDGDLTSGDARLALRASVKLEDYAKGSAQFTAADVDGNGLIESSDARLILRASVKLEDPSKWGK